MLKSKIEIDTRKVINHIFWYLKVWYYNSKYLKTFKDSLQ